MLKLANNLYKFAKDSLKAYDRYPKIISFTFKGEDEFKTLIGGIISIATYAVLGLYAYLMFVTMIDKKDTNKNTTTSIQDLIEDSDSLSLKDTTFMFGFNVISNDFDIYTDETYIDMSVEQVAIVNGAVTIKTIPLELCTYNHFPKVNKKLLDKIKIKTYICPKSNDLTLLGNQFSDSFSYFQISFKKCDETDALGNPCKSDTEITNALNSAALQMAMVNTYYDFDDYAEPVKTYFDDQFYYNFVSDFEKKMDIFVRQNSVEQKDSIYRYTAKGDESNFITIQKVKEKFSKSYAGGYSMTLRFFKDPESTSYERQVFSLLDCFGNIGGVNEVLEISGGIVVSFFSGKIFLFSILSSLYQVDSTRKKKKSKNFKSSKAHKQVNPKSSIAKINPDMHIENMIVKALKINDSYLAQKESDLSNLVVQEAADNMRNRYRRSLRNLHSRLVLYNKGEEKFIKEFDAVEFARTQRKLKMLVHWLMDKSELFLTAYQKTNAISLFTDSESSQSDDPAYLKIPKMLSRAKTKQKHIVTVDKFFDEYLKEKHTEKDVNLLHGVFSSKPPTYEIDIASSILKESKFDLNNDVNEELKEENKIDVSSSKESRETLNNNQTKIEYIDKFNSKNEHKIDKVSSNIYYNNDVDYSAFKKFQSKYRHDEYYKV